MIHLAAIGQLHLAHRLSPEVLVPQAVFDEVVVVGAGLPGALEVKTAAWLTVVTVARSEVVEALPASGLHRGESEAIAVAFERDADLQGEQAIPIRTHRVMRGVEQTLIRPRCSYGVCTPMRCSSAGRASPVRSVASTTLTAC